MSPTLNIKHYFPWIIISFCTLIFCQCGDKKASSENTAFTRIDSLTDTYLALQDSMLQTWNIMVNDDNIKVKSMHNLLHELMVSGPGDKEDLVKMEQRLDQLMRLRYTQKTMANADVVEEYDFASNSLISELISIAESRAEFTYNTTLQKLVDEIRAADQRVNNYRSEYDSVAMNYNNFLVRNKVYLKDIDQNDSFDKKPLFQMASDE